MIGRLIPPTLTETVSGQLRKERDAQASLERPRGTAGARHDRILRYLDLMLTVPVTQDDPRLAGPGDLVSVRFHGDAEHRTYLLTAEGRNGGPLNLPEHWPLARAVLGAVAGERRTYPREDGGEGHLTVIAVWDDEGEHHHLPEAADI